MDRVVTVTEDELALAILRIAELEKGVVEGAGAAPLAACLAGKVPELAGKNVVLPLCGGNIDPMLLSRVIEQGMVADGRLSRFTALLRDRPGALADFADPGRRRRGQHPRDHPRARLLRPGRVRGPRPVHRGDPRPRPHPGPARAAPRAGVRFFVPSPMTEA